MKKITILLSLVLFIFQNCENKIKNTSEVLEKQKVIKRSIEIATPTDEIIDVDITDRMVPVITVG